jgi:hypothetical protein
MPRRKCRACHEWFASARADARFCSAACKQRAYRRRLKPGPFTPIPCVDEEHHRYEGEAERQSHQRAAQWQVSEALRLADEFALFRNGAPKVSRRMLTQVRMVARRWRRLAAELQKRNSRDEEVK